MTLPMSRVGWVSSFIRSLRTFGQSGDAQDHRRQAARVRVQEFFGEFEHLAAAGSLVRRSQRIDEVCCLAS
jgi:hypothetical protein